MEFLIDRLAALGVNNPAGTVADCVDSGRLPWLMDYVAVRETLRKMEEETYVR